MKYSICGSYDIPALRKAVARLWDDFPDCRDRKVFIKPNLVTPPNRFDYQSCTHVNVVRIVVERCLDSNPTEVIIGECGFKGQWSKTMELCGYPDLLKLSPKVQLIPLQDGPNFHKFSLVRMPPGEYLSLYGAKFSNYLLDCDFVINLPKLKMHSMAFITGAIKNMMGTMSQKGSMHPRACSHTLQKRLRDFYFLIQPMTKFILMDGVIGSAYAEQYGIPMNSNLLLSETDCWRMDCYAASAMSVPALRVPYLSLINRKLGWDWPEPLPTDLVMDYERPLAWRKN